jgi:hypothetical protein
MNVGDIGTCFYGATPLKTCLANIPIYLMPPSLSFLTLQEILKADGSYLKANESWLFSSVLD